METDKTAPQNFHKANCESDVQALKYPTLHQTGKFCVPKSLFADIAAPWGNGCSHKSLGISCAEEFGSKKQLRVWRAGRETHPVLEDQSTNLALTPTLTFKGFFLSPPWWGLLPLTALTCKVKA